MRIRSTSIAAAAALFVVAGSASAQDHACQANLAMALGESGIKMGDIKSASFKTMRFDHRGTPGPVDGYQFTGQPASCSSGQLYVSMTTGCEISDMHTDGECKIKGVPHWWW